MLLGTDLGRESPGEQNRQLGCCWVLAGCSLRSLPTPNLPRFYNSASCFGERGTAARGCWPAASPRASAFPCVSGPCVGVPLGPGGGAWDSTQHITTSFCPSAPLQPEPKEERHKAAAGGEPFLRGTLPHPDVMLGLWDRQLGCQGHRGTPAPRVPPSSPRPHPGEVPKARSAVGGDPSLLGPLPQPAVG